MNQNTPELDELNNQEAEIQDFLDTLNGSIEEKTALVAAKGYFERYRLIHTSYAKLAKTGDLEALKRALFIQWYSVSEPSCFSGISNLAEKSEKGIFQILTSGSLHDPELTYMLQHYQAVNPGYMATLKKTLSGKPRSEFLVNTTKRGQMGDYWHSFQNSSVFKHK